MCIGQEVLFLFEYSPFSKYRSLVIECEMGQEQKSAVLQKERNLYEGQGSDYFSWALKQQDTARLLTKNFDSLEGFAVRIGAATPTPGGGVSAGGAPSTICEATNKAALGDEGGEPPAAEDVEDVIRSPHTLASFYN